MNTSGKFVMRSLQHHLVQLDQRDRTALKVLAVFTVLLLLYFTVLKPSFNYYHDSRDRMLNNHELLGWVLENGERARLQQRSSYNPSTSTPLIKQISDSAINLTLDRIQPEGEGLRVWINQAKLSDVLTWLATLATEHNIHIKQIAIEHAKTQGFIKVQVSLNRIGQIF